MTDQPMRILVVEDNEANRYAILRVLRRSGYQLLEAGSCAEARKRLAEAPDLVILDVNLPDGNGFALCREIKSSPVHGSTLVLNTSASFTSVADRVHGLDTGADGYLTQPLDPDVLLATVNALLRLRRSERAMQRSEQRYRALVEATAQVVWITDRLGQDTRRMAGWRLFTGQDQGQLAQGGWMDAIHPEDRQAARAAWVDSIAKGVPCEVTCRMRRHDGEYRYMQLRGVPVRDLDGGPIREWIGACSDVTERMQVAESLSRANHDLEQFAYIASHDLQEPLRMVTSFLGLLSRKYAEGLDDKARMYIASATDGAKGMQRLIRAVLEYSRADKGDATRVLVSSELVLRAALVNLGSTIEESGALIERADLPEIFVDPIQLAQVFQNLIGNALKFRSASAPVIHVRAEREELHWRFAVSDNGIGIDPAQHHRVFLAFQRLHSLRDYPGSGIGLAICKKIVERHGGRIWMESQPGMGTTFSFTLPAVAPGEPGATAPGSD